MGEISQYNLIAAGYDTQLICEFEPPHRPAGFWKLTFFLTNYYNIDLVVIINTPLPNTDFMFPCAVSESIGKIGRLEEEGTHVILINQSDVIKTQYSSRNLLDTTHSQYYYEDITELGAEVIFAPDAASCYWGTANPLSEKLQRLATLCAGFNCSIRKN